jgi:hypothetical protein
MTRRAVLTQFRALERCCSRVPYNDEAEAEDHVGDWLRVLEGLSDEQLEAAVTAWMRSPKGRFWPSPSELLQLAPRSGGPTLSPVSEDWPGKLWASLPSLKRFELLEQAGDVGCAQHPDGGPEIRVSCDACASALGHRLDELVRQISAAA